MTRDKLILNCNYTYLFEIIYPENRIIVDYGQKRDLILLGIIDTKTGLDVSLFENPGFNACNYSILRGDREDGLDLFESLKNDPAKDEGEEGFVLCWKNGFRMKIKFEQYLTVARIMAHLSDKHILDACANGITLSDNNMLPEEIAEEVLKKEELFLQQYDTIEYAARYLTDSHKHLSRKEFASYVIHNPYTAICFKMYDNKPYDELIWKSMKKQLKEDSND